MEGSRRGGEGGFTEGSRRGGEGGVKYEGTSLRAPEAMSLRWMVVTRPPRLPV